MNPKTIIYTVFYIMLLTLSLNIPAMNKWYKHDNKLREQEFKRKILKKVFEILDEEICNCSKCTGKHKCKLIEFIEEKWEKSKKLRMEGNTAKSIKLLYDHIAYQQLLPNKRHIACLYVADYLKFKKERIDVDATNEQITKECLYTLLKFENQKKLAHWIKGQAHMLKGQIYNRKLKEKHPLTILKKYKKKFITHMEQARKAFTLALEKKDENFSQEDQRHYLFCTLELANHFALYILDNYEKADSQKIERRKEKAISYFTQLTSYESENMGPLLIQDKIEACIHLANIYRLPICNKLDEALELYKKAITLTQNNQKALDEKFGGEKVLHFIQVAKNNISETKRQIKS